MSENSPAPSRAESSAFWRALDTLIPALLLFAFLGLVLIHEGAFSGRQYKDPGDGDCDYYVKQALQPGSVQVNPFVFRILTPTLVRILKVNSNHLLEWDAAWYLFTFLLVYGSGLLFFRFCRRVLNLSVSSSCLAALMLLANWVYARFQMEIPFFPDPLNNFLWMLAFTLLFTERWGWFYVTIAVGMLNKEVILFLAPLCPLFVYLKTGKLLSRPVLRHAALAAGICGAYWAYRYGVGRWIGMQEYRLLSTNDWGVLSSLLIGVNLQKSVWHLFNTFGFLWITFLLMLRELYTAGGWRNRYLVTSLVVFGICFFSRLFSTDVSRIYVMMAPLVVGLSAVYLDAIFAERKFPALVLLLFVVLAGNQGWIEGRAWLCVLNAAALFYIVLNANRPFPPGRVPV